MEETLTCNRSPFSQVFGRQGQLMQARCMEALCYHSVRYHYIDLALTWFKAKAYCKDHYNGLVTILTTEDNNRLSTHLGSGWIGLADQPHLWKGKMGKAPNSWRWSATESVNSGGYQNWKLNKPDNYNAAQYCVFIRNGQWDDHFCGTLLPFVCFTESAEQGSKQYTFVSTRMAWEAAQAHCRQSYTDLAMILEESENAAVASVIPSTTAVGVWIGLYRIPWRWWFNRTPTFTNWAPEQPDNYNGAEQCVMRDANNLWRDANCGITQQFYCQQDLQTKSCQIKMTLQTTADLSDSTVYNQIIQQLETKLGHKGLHDFNLAWKTSSAKI